MNVLVIGGTRFFGIPMVFELLRLGDEVTIATRGLTKDPFGNNVKRVILNVYDRESIRKALNGTTFDVVIDKMGYGSLDIKNILDNTDCGKIIHMSTAGVYHNLNHTQIKEQEFNPKAEKLVWCSRGDLDYDTCKRMSEAVLATVYENYDYSCVRSSMVFGKNDYLKRLFFYVQHIALQIPMFVDNLDFTASYAEEKSLGRFMAFLTRKGNVGAVNFCSYGLISIKEIIQLTEKICGKRAILSDNGDVSPFNGKQSFSLDLNYAHSIYPYIDNINDWIGELIEYYITLCESGVQCAKQ